MVAETLEREVRHRAQGRCEYCRVPTFAYIVPFQVDHVIAVHHGGTSELSNLALSCYHCNLHKGPNIASLDPTSNDLVRLFHPRQDHWAEHLEWDGAHRGTFSDRARNRQRACNERSRRRCRPRSAACGGH